MGIGDIGSTIKRDYMVRWEHRVVKSEDESLNTDIHKMEVLGWELVSVAGFVRNSYVPYKEYTLFFKRQTDDD